MLRRHNRDWFPRDVDLQFQQPRVNRREMLLDELGGLMADIQMNIIQAKPLDLMVDRKGHHIAGASTPRLSCGSMSRLPPRGTPGGSFRWSPSTRLAPVTRTFLSRRFNSRDVGRVSKRVRE